jgi:hypothetical protein
VPLSAVCISRTAGARGEEVGRKVADALGFRYVDEEIVLAAAEKEGLDPEQLATIEHSRTGLSRLEIDIVTGGTVDEIQRSLIREAIQQTAAAGKVVIVAHAASVADGRRTVLAVESGVAGMFIIIAAAAVTRHTVATRRRTRRPWARGPLAAPPSVCCQHAVVASVLPRGRPGSRSDHCRRDRRRRSLSGLEAGTLSCPR